MIRAALCDRIMKRLKRISEKAVSDIVATLLGRVVGIALVVAVVINVVNVLGRYVFNHALTGSEDLEIYLMIGIAFYSCVIAQIRQRHLRMDALSRHFPARFGRVVKGAEVLVSIAACGMMSWVSWRYTLKIYRIGSHSENAHIAMWIPHSMLAIAFTLMTLAALAKLASHARVRRVSSADQAATP
jgi:C4-dicarboxylate transporter, DctQ subunit